MPRPIFEIAREIRATWPKVNYAAVPYLEAMEYLTTMDSMYALDSAKSIVRYFLANASTYRGEAARRIKAELKSML